MQPLQHQMMGYDRSSTMFSPDGRLLQVEYAKKTVKQGSSALGLVCKDGVLLLADKRVLDKFIIPSSVEKVFQIDDHIGATASGFLMDGRILIERAQVIAQQHRVTYDEPINVTSLVREICNMKQAFTQYGGARPFGVSILFAGMNDKPHLFVTDVTGIFLEYKAAAIGESDTEIRAQLEKQYKEDQSLEDGLKMGMKILKKVLGTEFDIERIDGAMIKSETKHFHKLTKDELKKALK
ncbi:proteasome endopeptidase complex, archaeal, alpha subunit [archaeon]|nr:proteasome endopeptidase complex, archaeal, alpha subunit [archaeon]|tara:strand:+ start:334 stop:1047 length:714 start_codon:yes stop_codon:yes gene_type:complete